MNYLMCQTKELARLLSCKLLQLKEAIQIAVWKLYIKSMFTTEHGFYKVKKSDTDMDQFHCTKIILCVIAVLSRKPAISNGLMDLIYYKATQPCCFVTYR